MTRIINNNNISVSYIHIMYYVRSVIYSEIYFIFILFFSFFSWLNPKIQKSLCYLCWYRRTPCINYRVSYQLRFRCLRSYWSPFRHLQLNRFFKNHRFRKPSVVILHANVTIKEECRSALNKLFFFKVNM